VAAAKAKIAKSGTLPFCNPHCGMQFLVLTKVFCGQRKIRFSFVYFWPRIELKKRQEEKPASDNMQHGSRTTPGLESLHRPTTAHPATHPIYPPVFSRFFPHRVFLLILPLNAEAYF